MTEPTRRMLLWLPTPLGGSHTERREHLHQRFSQVAPVLSKMGVQLDLDSLMVSGQSLVAHVPQAQLETVARWAESQGLKLTPDTEGFLAK